MTIKKELKLMAQSIYTLDKQEYDYFMSNVKHIGFTDKEIVYLVHDIMFDNEFEKDDYEYKIVKYLLTQTSLRIHRKYTEIYANAFIFNIKVNSDLLLKY